MAANSTIEWTDATWPIVQGCDPVSPGCEGCYAIPLVHRLAWNPNPKVSAPIKGCVEFHRNASSGEGRLRFTGKVALREDRIMWPLQWKKPRMIFVPSHGDVFHKAVPDAFIDKIFAVMALCPQHTFQVLTKRARRMQEYCGRRDRLNEIELAAQKMLPSVGKPFSPRHVFLWPLPNVWLGVSAERQQEFDEREPELGSTKAAVRFFSLEPLLGPIDTRGVLANGVFGWVIVGGESGPGARPMSLRWAQNIREQCVAAGVPFFFKQWGAWALGVERVGKKSAGRLLDGREWNEFPQTTQTSSPPSASVLSENERINP